MKPPLVFLSAGEPSGDFLGSHLMKALKTRLKGQVNFTGVGGPLMMAEGLTSLFPIEELSVMGLAEVLPHLWRIRRRIQETVGAIEAAHPGIVVTIDSPGFNFRVGKALKKRFPAVPLVHYVAPSVWAWRPGRAKKIARFLDRLLVLFPFEPPYFLTEGLPTTFVGHPVVELDFKGVETPAAFRRRHGIAPDAPILTLLPGSRRGEIARLLPVFLETADRLRRQFPMVHTVIPTLPHLVTQIQSLLKGPATLVTTPPEKLAAYGASQAALAASGTVSLELAGAGLPMVIAYHLNPLTHFLVRRMVKVKYACLVNLLLNREVVPERLQSACIPENLAHDLEGFFRQERSPDSSTLASLQEAVRCLQPPAPYATPSACAADQICRIMKENQAE